MSTDPAATAPPEPATPAPTPARGEVGDAAGPSSRSNRRRNVIALIVGVLVLDVLAFLVIPPFSPSDPTKPASSIADLIAANLEFPSPNIVFDLDPSHPVDSGAIIFVHASITAPLFTMWFVMAFIVVVAFLASRGMKPVPGRAQNAIELAWESLENWATSLGGDGAKRHVPLFVAFFLFILFSNWSGLLPFFGKIELFRAPTSDVNVTIGLALVVYIYFNYQGFRNLGVRRYLGKFFVFSGFKHGIGSGAIDLFVGLIELMLEFVKPVTLAMRLFGNIFGGEVALGVITALTVALVPAAMLLLEGLLNFVQALIFSTLMLMYTIIAVESHEAEEHAAPTYSDDPEGNLGPPLQVAG